jgi:hypothetical protein
MAKVTAPCFHMVSSYPYPYFCARGDTFHRFPGYGSASPWWASICTL